MSSKESKDLSYYVKNYWQYVFLLLIVFSVVSMRAQVSDAPITDTWARNAINQNIANQITSEVNSKYPNLPQTSKENIIQNDIMKYNKENRASINEGVKSLSSQYKDLISYEYNNKKYIYLGDIDSYYWLRFAKNVEEKGYICDEIIDGECWDNHALAPLGRKDTATMHPYVIAGVHKLSKFIGYDIPLMQASLITPTIIAVITVFAAYFAGLLLYGKLAGIVASILISFNVMYVSRSIGSDNDIYNLLFPLLILGFLFIAVNAKKNKKMILAVLISGFLTGFFDFAWPGGWANIFNAIIYAFVMYIGFLIVHEYWSTKSLIKALKTKILKRTSSLFGLYWIGGFIGYGVSAIIKNRNPLYYIGEILQPIRFAKFAKSAVNLNVWPNVRTTVAEFNSLPLQNVPQQVFGGSHQTTLLFFIGLIGITFLIISSVMNKKTKWPLISFAVIISILYSVEKLMINLSVVQFLGSFVILVLLPLVYLIYKKQKLSLNREHHLFAGMILLIWFAGTMFATTKGIRFALLVAPVIALAIGVGLNKIYNSIDKWATNQYKGRALMAIQIISIIALLILPLTTTSNAFIVTKNFVPNYNAAWDSALIKIREESQSDAIVNSWWDFGHWFKYTTDRGVTLDGATQNSPVLHWLGKALLTDNETVSNGIIRMMDCGSNKAYDVIVNTTKDIPVAVDIVNKIIVLDDKDEVRAILASYGMNKSEQEKTLQYSHCDAPENFLITSNDMVGKGGVWAHFGAWDFYKAEIAQMKLAGYSKEDIIQNITSKPLRNTTREEVEKLYKELIRQRNNNQINTWIAPWPSFMGDSPCKRKGDSFTCSNGVVYNTTSKEVVIKNKHQISYPKRFMYIGEDGVVSKEYTKNLALTGNGEIGIMLMQTNPNDNNTLTASVMHPKLVGSMFARLYYTQGHGLKYFNYFDHKSSPIGTNIWTWKSDWLGNSTINIYNK